MWTRQRAVNKSNLDEADETQHRHFAQRLPIFHQVAFLEEPTPSFHNLLAYFPRLRRLE